MNSNKLLYIGLNGLAGSGKDTVAKMLKVILLKNWDNIDECKQFYNTYYAGPTISATFNKQSDPYTEPVMCIAFADQLKTICSSIFGIPVTRFYNNKSNAWICINKDFHYTEIRPENVITCEEYYYNCSEYKNSSTRYYLSLRDILVYIGTFVLQQDINKEVFINIVQNTIKEVSFNNSELKYVIVTDIRFIHEFEYLNNNNGITIKITRPEVEALDNVAEHDLDDEDRYTYTIENDGTYDDLFQQVWDLVHDETVFRNEVKILYTRDNVDNYLRKIDEDAWQLCSPYPITRINHTNGDISMIDLIGGPTIYVDEEIPGTHLIPNKIELAYNNSKFVIYTENGDA